MQIRTEHSTVTAEAVGRFWQEQARRSERRLLHAGRDQAELRRAADELMGTTFFAVLLKQARAGLPQDGYFGAGLGERFFMSQLDQELARRVSVSGRLHLGEVLIKGGALRGQDGPDR
ncbi:MAG: rod-binding protein [Phycisphaerae bacterium]